MTKFFIIKQIDSEKNTVSCLSLENGVLDFSPKSKAIKIRNVLNSLVCRKTLRYDVFETDEFGTYFKLIEEK